jgi:phosphoribosylaminoimidazolecarboxamide formyltransferase / IMP cyclohydrolase
MQNTTTKEIKSVLLSLYHKEPALELIKKLHDLGVIIYSTGGTLDYILQNGMKAIAVEDITTFPSVFGGRVKTLHPKIFGGILYRRDNKSDIEEMAKHDIPSIDMVVVDLYPFEDTVLNTQDRAEIIEKIDIGGISLIRAAAKNYNDTLIVPSSDYYQPALDILNNQGNHTTLQQREDFAAAAFNVSSHYDTAIYSWFKPSPQHGTFKRSFNVSRKLRYGENPHQEGYFFGKQEDSFTQLHGKELSYNNILDIDGAISLIREFEEPTFAIIKHTNACGLASRPTIEEAYRAAFASDPVSAFGGILIANRNIDEKTAYDINELFFEVILAPEYSEKALEILNQKKNRIILLLKDTTAQKYQYKSALNGVLVQSDNDAQTIKENWSVVTSKSPESKQESDLIFANKIVKHTKSNAIVLVKNKQLLAAGTGQTSRVDALKQAIVKAKEFKHQLKGAVMASDAFFPFADCVEIAYHAGIKAVIQPGGSIRDKDSVDYCDANDMVMITTGLRLFKH